MYPFSVLSVDDPYPSFNNQLASALTMSFLFSRLPVGLVAFLVAVLVDQCSGQFKYDAIIGAAVEYNPSTGDPLFVLNTVREGVCVCVCLSVCTCVRVCVSLSLVCSLMKLTAKSPARLSHDNSFFFGPVYVCACMEVMKDQI